MVGDAGDRQELSGRARSRGVSLTLRRGEAVALLGENGDKSTLINVLSGVFPSYDREILIEGLPSRSIAALRRGVSGSRPSTRSSTWCPI